MIIEIIGFGKGYTQYDASEHSLAFAQSFLSAVWKVPQVAGLQHIELVGLKEKNQTLKK